MQVPNRYYNGADYRYGFQGQEKDNEIKGDGNSLNYTFRMHDPRIGRFFAPDPMESSYPWYSPYQFSGNKVIHAVELEGLEEFVINDVNGKKKNVYGPHKNNEDAQIFYNSTINSGSIKPRDEYEEAILNGDITFNKRYGWVDETHAFTNTKRKDPYVGVQNLWNQLLNEPTDKSKIHLGRFGVIYKQDIVVGGYSVGIEHMYAVKTGLSIEEKKSVALMIFQNVSREFEKLQSTSPTSSSSFEPADLPSNMLSFYRIVQTGMNTTKIKNIIQPLDVVASLIIYRSYPGTFTDKKYKNHNFEPFPFKTIFTPNGFNIPNELKTIKPDKSDNVIFVDRDIIKKTK